MYVGQGINYFVFSCFSAPNGTPQNPVALTFNSTAILVQWEQVPEVQRNGEITFYEILVNPAQFQSVSYMNVSSPMLMVMVTGLEEYVEYTFTIRAYTSAGLGPFSNSTTTRTDTAG